ncbi:hypothetical protein LTR91_005476 [Friedmanniomyces endolithicus]|uniref:Xylanolytic transcriptional activator regulatory domain-containing protein n=1 Tax=Friedmanniomyces endolithicus TaxID=329885 RepID=A0AAN6KTQ4_9PEZI|nr:hypothetical protein LTR01_006277 [Friedmanniomyces endolithicus]KAK0322501.1 hypothetical protein LTR82_006460 [Friedmanniomyces endolithicus]KAK0824966.1 hypothetical protein LTR73_007253 [Friedmanniomyces endolithicus]KAK0921983.1 hypothetical protein LTR57_008127 [Friedmanniomyces endolithicus]KAK0966633.1 hypothetical protein LTS01_017659 [Friedmanniomyces endolithicus]
MDAESITKTEGGSETTPKDKKDKRTSRACLTCRTRKSACHLPGMCDWQQQPGESDQYAPAMKEVEADALRSGQGGKRERKKRSVDDADLGHGLPIPQTPRLEVTGGDGSPEDRTGFDTVSSVISPPNPALFIDPALRADLNPLFSGPGATRESSTGSGNITFNELQNPSDALGILAQIASDGEAAYSNHRHLAHSISQNTLDYPLVADGRLSPSRIVGLLQRYKYVYHPYFPLVPAATLDSANLTRTAREEKHLLTAILVIASRDLTDEPNVFTACAEHMRSLVSCLAAGGPGNIETVEALLLLAEWTPYTSRSDAGHVGRGEEDREAWMHVGTALRIGYYLGLDRYSFAVRGDDIKDPQWQRKRLVWTACYISDRQISIRLGRAFWSRGPGPLTTLRKEDFPSLAAATPGDEDFASIFQATLELTLLFSNVHDVLYSNPGNSMRSHLSGGYIKYIDDFRSAIYGWKSVWGTLTCSPNLKATLLMSYDYLRLYTNAFAFHATLKRALASQEQSGEGLKQTRNPSVPQRVFYNNVGAVGDARFIYEGLDAAKSILSMCNTFVDPEKALRYMPLRFYLYCVYSAVFLYRARCAGVLSADEENSVRQMVTETVARLERSGIGFQHPGSRYSRLLRLLWEKVDRKEHKRSQSTATLTNPYRPGGSAGPTPGSSASSAPVRESPAMTEMMGDFSWTDLDAIGNFAVNGNNPTLGNEAEWWSGFLPTDGSNFLMDTFPGMGDWDLGVQ